MPPPLTTDRFTLQRIEPEDQPFIFEGLSHPQVIPFYGVRYYSLEATKAQMDFYKTLERDGTGEWWKIVSRQSEEAVGAIGYNQYQAQHKKAEIGYWLLPRFWKQGIITEAMPALLRYMRREKGIHCIEALVEEGNTASNRLVERMGFLYEGTMRDCEISLRRLFNSSLDENARRAIDIHEGRRSTRTDPAAEAEPIAIGQGTARMLYPQRLHGHSPSTPSSHGPGLD